MPSIPPGQPIAPGIATGNQFPQYGVGGGKPGSPAGWKIVTAQNNAEKTKDIQQGFFVWFQSKKAAQDFISSESSQFGSGQVPVPGWNLVFGNWKGILIRSLKIGFGAILITAGILKLTNADKTLNQVLPLVGGPAGKVLKV